MIELHNLRKSFGQGAARLVVADGISMTLPARRSIALLGRNGAGKSTLLRMIAGTLDPDSGKVRRHGSLSWPVGFAGGFHHDLTGAQNARFIARIYGVKGDALCDFVNAFAELGPLFHKPYGTYSSGMRARLAFGASLGLRFDTYLIDAVTSVGDAGFREKSTALLESRLTQSGAIIVSHGKGMLRRLCDCALVLDQGRLTFFEDLEMAFAVHDASLRRFDPPMTAA